MFTETTENTNGYGVFEGCYATVVDHNRKGSYLILDNGENAFAFGFSSLWRGTKVLCTVRRLSDGERFKLVSIDAVIHYPVAA